MTFRKEEKEKEIFYKNKNKREDTIQITNYLLAITYASILVTLLQYSILRPWKTEFKHSNVFREIYNISWDTSLVIYRIDNQLRVISSDNLSKIHLDSHTFGHKYGTICNSHVFCHSDSSRTISHGTTYRSWPFWMDHACININLHLLFRRRL